MILHAFGGQAQQVYLADKHVTRVAVQVGSEQGLSSGGDHWGGTGGWFELQPEGIDHITLCIGELLEDLGSTGSCLGVGVRIEGDAVAQMLDEGCNGLGFLLVRRHDFAKDFMHAGSGGFTAEAE